jgi:hypothetical protein
VYFSYPFGDLVMKSGMNCLQMAAAICVVASTAAALGQGQGGRRGGGNFFGGRGGGMGNDPTVLLGMEPVQKELELSAEQKTQVTKLAEEAQQARMDLFQSGASREDMQTKMQDLGKANKKKADDILLDKQRARLDQISLQFAIQMAGPSAFIRPELADKLGLTAEQKDKIQTISDETQEKRRDIFQDANGDFQGAQEKIGKLNTEQKDKAMGLLTSDQKTKLDSMTGKEFKIDITQMFRGGPGGRRGAPGN